MKKNSLGTAIIVEPRKHAALFLVVKNMHEYLPPTWTILVVHGTHNGNYAKGLIEPLNDIPNRPKIKFTQVPYRNITIDKYNDICMSDYLYNLSPHENILIFQTHSIILNKNVPLDRFLKYAYVGAPFRKSGIGNGGFSLRKKSVMINHINKSFHHTLSQSQRLGIPFKKTEDRFISNFMRKNKNLKFPNPDDPSRQHYYVNIPSRMVAHAFSSERQFIVEDPLGCHKPWLMEDKNLLYRCIRRYPIIAKLMQLQHTEDDAPQHRSLESFFTEPFHSKLGPYKIAPKSLVPGNGTNGIYILNCEVMNYMRSHDSSSSNNAAATKVLLDRKRTTIIPSVSSLALSNMRNNSAANQSIRKYKTSFIRVDRTIIMRRIIAARNKKKKTTTSAADSIIPKNKKVNRKRISIVSAENAASNATSTSIKPYVINNNKGSKTNKRLILKPINKTKASKKLNEYYSHKRKNIA